MSLTELMWDGYAQYSRRDFSFVDSLFAEDIRWRTPGAEGGIEGRAAVHAFFQGLTEMFSAHTIELVDAVEDGDRLVCFCLHRFTRPDGASAEVDSVMDWRFSGQQVVSMREIADTMAFAQIAGLVPAAA